LPDEIEREKQIKERRRELIEDGTLFKRQLCIYSVNLGIKKAVWEEKKAKGKIPSYRSHYAYCFDP